MEKKVARLHPPLRSRADPQHLQASRTAAVDHHRARLASVGHSQAAEELRAGSHLARPSALAACLADRLAALEVSRRQTPRTFSRRFVF